ncbi:uncharacterized protein LOC129808697 [Phlebotomus papatasi]|uniref:uncharacterized protein LOC129808697 n=1 Tax=Phlebotomus papatasi TaxID=29031 RepID=UPI0024844915|nr:uncharacterized protein LOC129808697 [Phlebotomus papatasi]
MSIVTKNMEGGESQLSQNPKSRKDWSDGEVRMFISIWRDHHYDLRRQKRHRKVHQAMSEELKKNGVNKTENEVKTKIKNMTARYREEKRKVGTSGGSPSTWAFYEEMNSLIGNLPVNDENLVDEGNIIMSLSDSLAGNEEEIASSSIQAQGHPNPRRSRKRKLINVQEEMLQEIKRSNEAAERNDEIANAHMKESNRIAQQQIAFNEKLLARLFPE